MTSDELAKDQIRINYDDDQLEVIEKVNRVLKLHNLMLVDDAKSHEGYCIFTLQTTRAAS
jgi:hypothetical protein